MRIVKQAGSNAWGQRRLTLHGSSARRGMARSGGKLQRWGSQPGGPKRGLFGGPKRGR